MRFSRRSQVERGLNALTARREQLERDGARLVDLTESNPTRCELVAPLVLPSVERYQPVSMGEADARRAVASLYGCSSDAVCLGASTSELYGWLFTLFCDAGDVVLTPRPSYPLVDELARVHDVRCEPYVLHALDDHWALDVEALRSATDAVRAVVLISPANPTGHRPTDAELDALLALCAEREWALIVDEVFHDPDRHGAFIGGRPSDALVVSLGGLSKLAGLPQAKLSWSVMTGAGAEEALRRLEHLADGVLPVSSAVQHAAPKLIAESGAFRRAVAMRIAANDASLRANVPGEWSVMPQRGGWSAVLRLPQRADEEALCLAALDAGVIVQPGFFFDMPRGQWLVVSLLPQPAVFTEGLGRLVRATSSGFA